MSAADWMEKEIARLARKCDRLRGRIAELEADSAEAFAAWIAKSGGMIKREVSIGWVVLSTSIQPAHVVLEEFREARDGTVSQ